MTDEKDSIKDKEYYHAVERMKKRRAKFIAFWKSFWILFKYRFLIKK